MADWDSSKDYIGSVTVYISEVTKSILLDSLSIQSSVSNRTSCDFDMYVSSKNDIKLGNSVDIFVYLNDSLNAYVFSGRVKNIKIKAESIGGQLKASINCVDYTQVLDRTLVAEEYVNKSINYIVTDIYNKYLTNEWIAIYTYPIDNVIIEKAVFSYISVADCFKYLCDETAYNYTVSEDGWIDFFYRDDLTTEDMETSHILDIDLEYDLDDYRNRQFVKGGYDETPITNEVLTPKPDGNTTTFFSRFPVGAVPTVKIDNVTVSSSSVGIDGIDADKWFYWNKSVNKLSQNTELLATLSGGTVSMNYKGLVKILIEADNVEGQTEMSDNETSTNIIGTGIYSNIEEVGTIQTRNEAINYANGLLYKYNKIPEVVNVKSWVYRQIGRTIFINYPSITDDQLFFIESRSSYFENGIFRHNYKMLNGESLGNWTEFFRKIYKQSQDMLINEDIKLIKLQQQPEQWDICSELNIGVFTLKTIEDDLYLSEYETLGTVMLGKQYIPTFIDTNLYLSNSQTISTILNNGFLLKDT